jgi:hypothetical protein
MPWTKDTKERLDRLRCTLSKACRANPRARGGGGGGDEDALRRARHARPAASGQRDRAGAAEGVSAASRRLGTCGRGATAGRASRRWRQPHRARARLGKPLARLRRRDGRGTADWLHGVSVPDKAGEANPASSPGTPASRAVSQASENELLKKLETERVALRLEQRRHAATEAARLAAAAERDDARVEVARLTAEVRRAKGLSACLTACLAAAGGAALLLTAGARPAGVAPRPPPSTVTARPRLRDAATALRHVHARASTPGHRAAARLPGLSSTAANAAGLWLTPSTRTR